MLTTWQGQYLAARRKDQPPEACTDMRSSLSGLRGLSLYGDRSQLVDMLRAVTDDPLGYVTFKLALRAISLLGMCSYPGRTAEPGNSPAETGGFFRAPPEGFPILLTATQHILTAGRMLRRWWFQNQGPMLRKGQWRTQWCLPGACPVSPGSAAGF